MKRGFTYQYDKGIAGALFQHKDGTKVDKKTRNARHVNLREHPITTNDYQHLHVGVINGSPSPLLRDLKTGHPLKVQVYGIYRY